MKTKNFETIEQISKTYSAPYKRKCIFCRAHNKIEPSTVFSALGSILFFRTFDTAPLPTAFVICFYREHLCCLQLSD